MSAFPPKLAALQTYAGVIERLGAKKKNKQKKKLQELCNASSLESPIRAGLREKHLMHTHAHIFSHSEIKPFKTITYTCVCLVPTSINIDKRQSNNFYFTFSLQTIRRTHIHIQTHLGQFKHTKSPDNTPGERQHHAYDTR